MENQQLICSFEAYKHSVDWFLVLVGLLAVGTALGIWWLNKKVYEDSRDKNMKNVYVMFLTFVCLIACGSWLFKAFSLWSLKPIEIYSHSIKTPNGRADFKDITDFFVKPHFVSKSMDPNSPVDSTRFLMIMERKGGDQEKMHVLSEGDYPVDSVFACLSRLME